MIDYRLKDGRRYIEPEDALAELTELAQPGDQELGHMRADSILVELLIWGYYIGNLDDLPEGYFDDLLSAYDAVPKWYA